MGVSRNETIEGTLVAQVSTDEILGWPDVSGFEAISRLEKDGWAVVAGELPAAPADVGFVNDLVMRAVGGLFPAWLPEAAELDWTGAGLEAVRRVALRAAQSSDLFGPFLEAMSVAALKDGTEARVTGFSTTTSIRECYKLARRSWPSAVEVGIVLEVEGGRALDPERERDLTWLAGLSTFPIRIVGPTSAHLSRIQVRSELEAATTTVVTSETMPPYASPISGRPKPLSGPENRLEKYLTGCTWAHGRRWNHTIDLGLLEPGTQVDLLWEDERVIVELDGPEHARIKYGADRRRDRLLQARGFSVLRFTNEEVMQDVVRTAQEVAGFLEGKRKEQ